jgi:hypothetical protein
MHRSGVSTDHLFGFGAPGDSLFNRDLVYIETLYSRGGALRVLRAPITAPGHERPWLHCTNQVGLGLVSFVFLASVAYPQRHR